MDDEMTDASNWWVELEYHKKIALRDFYYGQVSMDEHRVLYIYRNEKASEAFKHKTNLFANLFND